MTQTSTKATTQRLALSVAASCQKRKQSLNKIIDFWDFRR
jgi:hypothetical protein